MADETETMEVASKAISHMISCRNSPHSLLLQLINNHRTHQQMTGSAMFELIQNVGKLYASEDRSRYFDLRNEQFGKMCAEINKFMEDNRHEYWFKLPVI